MNKWEKAYKGKGFAITTQKPSYIAEWMIKYLPKNGKVLDLGCGNGRNVIFFAKNGFQVDAIDTVDLDFVSGLPDNLKNNIDFTLSSVEERIYKKNYYQGVIMARLIQYIKR